MNNNRRKQLAKAHDLLAEALAEVQNVQQEEEAAKDNLPESFCDKADAMQEILDTLEEVAGDMQDALDNLSPLIP